MTEVKKLVTTLSHYDQYEVHGYVEEFLKRTKDFPEFKIEYRREGVTIKYKDTVLMRNGIIADAHNIFNMWEMFINHNTRSDEYKKVLEDAIIRVDESGPYMKCL